MTDTKPCLICGATITRTKQSATGWAKRTYCSNACSWAARAASRESAASAEARAGICEVCRGPLPRRRIAKLPWCSNPCKATWKAAHPDDDAGIPPRKRSHEDAEPPVRLRSELLPADTPRKTWIDRTPGHVAVCCGHCRRRFPRASIRLAERLLTMHRRTCGSGL